MRHTIRFKLFSTFIGLLIVIVIIIFSLTNLFLDNIINYTNMTIIEETFENHLDDFNDFRVDDDVINRITTQNNVGLVVIEDQTIKDCNASFLCDNNTQLPTYVSKHMPKVQEGKIKYFFIQYEILGVNELIYIYNVDNDRYIIISKSLETIEVMHTILRPFIGITSLLTLFLGTIAIYIFSKKLTDPIVNISSYAENIANQKFNQKITVYRKDELGQLANNMNKMNDQLSKALSELKTDLEKEKEMDRKRVKFFSAISHELKTPLTIIQGYADGLKHNIASNRESVTEYSQIIINETKKMNRLINDLLNLSLLESENFKLIKESFDLKQHIQSIAETYIETIKDKIIKYEFIARDSSYLINSDKYRLEQVVLNLLSNAVKYIEDDGLIRVTLINNESTITIKVYNNGAHIKEKELNNIWNAFYKVEDSGNYIGTGLGLAIVRSIVELHRGTYDVKNKEIGVEFSVTLPKK